MHVASPVYRLKKPNRLDTGVIMSSKPQGNNEVQKPATRTSAQVGVTTTLPEAMTGRASPAKAAVGDQPVFAYIASLPQTPPST